MDSAEVFYMICETPLTDKRVSSRTNHDPEKIKISSILIKHPDLASSSAKWAHIFLSFLLSFLWSFLQSRFFSAFYCEIVPRAGQLLPSVKSLPPLLHPKQCFSPVLDSGLKSPPTVYFTHLALWCWPGLLAVLAFYCCYNKLP